MLQLLCLVILASCKSKKTAIDVVASKRDFEKVNSFKKFKKIQEQIKQDFTSVILESDVNYSAGGMRQKAHAEIRLLRDQKIHITVRYFGITMAKAILTPNAVNYYEKLGGSYYQGDYTAISNWMGVPLDFYTIQNIVLGKTIEDFSDETYDFERLSNKFRITEKESLAINHIFEFNISDMLLREQRFFQKTEDREMIVSYDERIYTMDSVSVLLPKKIDILASQKAKAYRIGLYHNSIKLNKKTSYAYKVPNGYKRLEIK